MTLTETLLFAGFLAVFAAMWLGMTALLGAMSGWKGLEERYRDTEERALLKLRGQSGVLNGVEYRGVMDLSACRSGLRVSVWRLFGFSQKPFLVPWASIRAEDTNLLFFQMTQLTFEGHPGQGLRLMRGVWKRLVAARSVV